MPNRRNSDNGEYEFTRAAYDELKDAENNYGVQFDLFTQPADQRGVWVLCVGAIDPDGGSAIAYICRYQASWPNSVAISYGAFLYACCHRVVRMVEAWHTSKEEDTATRKQ
jgi:hypothetical protein